MNPNNLLSLLIILYFYQANSQSPQTQNQGLPFTDSSKDSSNKTSSNDTTTSHYTLLQSFSSKSSIIDHYGPSAFLTNGGIVSTKNRASLFLCNLKVSPFCKSKHIADSIDLMISFNPIYSYHQENMPVLYQRHKDFVGYMKSIGVPVVTVEAIFPSQGQEFKVTTAGNEPWEIQLHLKTPMYYRENLVNVGARKTKDLWEYLLMIDGHQFFDNLYWWEELIWKLERHTSVQFSTIVTYLNHENKTMAVGPSAAYSYSYLASPLGCNGNSWAVRKEIYEKIDRIVDECIAGGCDGAFFFASIRPEDIKIILGEPNQYTRQFTEWIWSASKNGLKGQVAHVRGDLWHLPHEHPFDYYWAMKTCTTGYDSKRDLVRDENYTIHLRNKYLADAFQGKNFGSVTGEIDDIEKKEESNKNKNKMANEDSRNKTEIDEKQNQGKTNIEENNTSIQQNHTNTQNNMALQQNQRKEIMKGNNSKNNTNVDQNHTDTQQPNNHHQNVDRDKPDQKDNKRSFSLYKTTIFAWVSDMYDTYTSSTDPLFLNSGLWT